MPKWARILLIAISLSNLCFLSSWLVLLNPSHYTYYYWNSDPRYVEFQALGLDILLLALIFWGAAVVTGRLDSGVIKGLTKGAFLLTLVVPVNMFISDYEQIPLSNLVTGRSAIGVGLLGVAMVLFTVSRLEQACKTAIVILIFLSPLVLVNLVTAVHLRAKHVSSSLEFNAKHPSTFPAVRSDLHVIWIIFDELEENMLFDNRPDWLQLPEFDRLSRESVTATRAYPPNGFTFFSIPSLMTGNLVSEARPTAANELALTLLDGAKVDWSKSESVFSQARAEGFTTGLAGWFHPYCRVIGSELDECSWEPAVDNVNPAIDELTIPRAMLIWTRMTIFRIPLVFRLFQINYERARSQEHVEEYDRILAHAKDLLRDDINLKFLHFPVPHQPWIYDAKSKSLSTSAGGDYANNLALADRTLGEIRRVLEQEWRWDNSVVLVTSDHWWRQAPLVNGRRDHRIPFILKLSGQKSAVKYDVAFNTILTRKLLIQLLTGNLTTPDQIVQWLSRNSTIAESPLTQNLP